jgi:nucleoside-diphosphate-sugar epimerase
VSRSTARGLPQAVEFVAGDATDAASMRAVAAGASVIYNCVNPPFTQWRELFPHINQTLIAAAGSTGATLVFADDTWMYGPPTGPLTEEHPSQPAGAKGALRAELADRLLDAHRRGDVRAVIGRASELYGPHVESLLGANLFRAALNGGRAMWPGSLDSPLNPTFIDDFACALITLGASETALGQVWHIPTAEPITGRTFTRLLYEEAGARLRVGVISAPLVGLLKLVWPVAREGAELLFQFESSYVVDASKYRKAFGGTVTPYREGIRQTLGWHRSVLEAERRRRRAPWWQEVWRYGQQR